MDYKNILKELLAVADNHQASDIHLRANSRPYLRIKGLLEPCSGPLDANMVKNIIFASMTEEQKKYLAENKEIDYAFRLSAEGSRYRINAFTAQGEIEAVLRVVDNEAKTVDSLRLPSIVNKLATVKNGLVLVAGATGSGKSTTLAAMIDYVNQTEQKRIITIENPVEIVHKDKKSVISQREVGIDTESFASALRSVLRQNPDIILIGEIRDRETAESALQAAQTGHLVLSTIHAGTAEETIKRFASLYPAEERVNAKRALAYSLKGILVQRLVIDVSEKKLPVLEIMTSTDRIIQALLADAEEKGGESITKIIADSELHGMLTLDQYLIKLVAKGLITVETALSEAVSPLMLRQNLHRRGLQTN